MSVETWLLFCITEALLCFSPGPAVLLCLTLSMLRGQLAGFAASLGVLLANVMYFALTATGLALLLAQASLVFDVIKYAGALYLIYLGVQLLRSAYDLWQRGMPAVEPIISTDNSDAFVKGFITQAANPKLIIYFGAILPQFVDTQLDINQQVMILGLSSVLIEVLVLAFYCRLGVKAAQFARLKVRAYIEGLGGGFLVAAGLGLARQD